MLRKPGDVTDSSNLEMQHQGHHTERAHVPEAVRPEAGETGNRLNFYKGANLSTENELCLPARYCREAKNDKLPPF
jgi:hypothetical protein